MDGNNHNPTLKAASAIVKLEIILDQSTGAVTVNGPIDQALFCYGILECARQVIQHHTAEKAKGNRIIPANMLPFVKPAS